MAANDLMLFYQSEEQNRQKLANTALSGCFATCTGRLGLCAFFGTGSELWQFSVSQPFLPSRQ